MSIAFLCPSVNPTKGGVERVTNILGNYLESHGYKIYYIALKQEGNKDEKGIVFLPDDSSDDTEANRVFLQNFCITHHINIIIAQIGAPGKASELVASLSCNIKKIACLHMNIFDSVRHFGANNYRLFNNLHLAWLSNLFENNFITDFLIYIKKLKYKDSYKSLVLKFDRIVLLSDSFKPDISYLLNGNKLDNVVSIPNPLDITDDPLDLDIKEKILLYVGRVNCAEKRLDYLLQIWDKFYRIHNDWRLVIVGDGPDLSFLKAKALKMGLKNYSFEGFQNPDSYYKKASIFCLTSANESFGMVLIEAMRYGVVPIAFDSYASVKDIIRNGVDGMIVKPFNLQNYADSISLLAANVDLRREMATRSYNKSKLFSVDSVGKIWLNLLDTLKN